MSSRIVGSRGDASESSQKYARSLVGEAIALVLWLHEDQLELANLRQDLVDEWIAAGSGMRRRVRLFLVWLARSSVTSRLTVAWDDRVPTREAITDEQRFATLRRLLHDQDIDLRDRFAGSVLLLYGRPITKIAGLRTADIDSTADGTVTLRLGRGATPLHERSARSRSPYETGSYAGPRRKAGCCPVGTPDSTSQPTRCCSDSSATGSTAAAEAGTRRCSLWPRGSQRRSSLSGSGSIKAARRSGPSRRRDLRRLRRRPPSRAVVTWQPRPQRACARG